MVILLRLFVKIKFWFVVEWNLIEIIMLICFVGGYWFESSWIDYVIGIVLLGVFGECWSFFSVEVWKGVIIVLICGCYFWNKSFGVLRLNFREELIGNVFWKIYFIW